MSGIHPDKIVTIHDIFTFFYLYPLRKAAAVLPPNITRLISRSLVHIYSLLPVSKKRRTSIYKTLSAVFGTAKTKKEIRILARKCFLNAVYIFIDDIVLNRVNKDDLLKCGVVKGLENLEEALANKKGVLLVGGHFTGDRASKLLLRKIGFPILNVRTRPHIRPSTSIVEREYLLPVMTRIFDNVLKDSVYVEDKGFGIEILKRLRENGMVSILFDAIASRKGLYCSFLGGQRFFPTNFLEIAQITGAAIVPMVCIGDSSSFTVIIDKKIELQQFSDKETFISANLNTLVKILEAQILQYPTHWLIL